MTTTGRIELMAPAGNFESLQAALDNGCDSVYFGVEQLNMRARATVNFVLEDLPEIARRCQEKNVRTYLTLNTIIYDHDLSIVKTLVLKAKEAGITAVIASDQAVIMTARTAGLEVHISTQLNVTNIETVKFYAMFADTIVLSRELSLRQVKKITDDIEKEQIKGPSGNLIEIEIFGHGALCMAVSGKCYMSLHSHFASANRGACVQNCRRSYVVMDKDEGVEFEVDNEYIMSAADLCTIDFLDKIIAAGVSVLKIEGRGRAADYVFTTTQCYREAIDAYYDGTFSAEKVADWKERLSTVFNRGFWDGYYLGRKMGEWSDEPGSKATKRKVYIGKGMKYYEGPGIGEFLIEAQNVKVGDELIITGPTTGVVELQLESLRIDDEPAEVAKRGATITFPVNEKVRPSDKLYKLGPVE